MFLWTMIFSILLLCIVVMVLTENEKYKHAGITRLIIGCAMTVHTQLGNGFQELIYHRALAMEMKKKELMFVDELEVSIFYDGIEIGKRRADFLVEKVIPVEIKAVKQLDNIHLAQAVNYLEAYKMEVGLLINFGSIRLDFHRIGIPNRPNKKPPQTQGLQKNHSLSKHPFYRSYGATNLNPFP